MPTDRYSRTARFLHWLTAIIVVWATITGFAQTMLAVDSPARTWISGTNVSLTTLLIPFFLYRVIHKLITPRPVPLPLSRSQVNVAAIGHALLYVLTGIVLLSGVLMMDKPIEIFEIVSLPNPMITPGVNNFFNVAHRSSCVLLALLVTTHIGAVIVHQLKGHQIMRRIC